MAEMLEVTCRSCGTISEQLDGALMSGYQPRCVKCGKTKLVSIARLMETDPDLDHVEADVWTLREQRIPELAGRCECGGTFSLDAPLRCPSCHATDVTTVSVGLAD